MPTAKRPTDLVASGGEELDGWERVDLDIFEFVPDRVHLGDHDLLRVFIFLSQLLPGRRQLFAMATPRSV